MRKTCTVPNRDQNHYARGLCKKHHARWRMFGDPNANVRSHRPSGMSKEEYAPGLFRCLLIWARFFGKVWGSIRVSPLF